MKALLLGCGYSRKKQIVPHGTSKEFEALTTLDIDRSCNPDIIHDLDVLPYPLSQNCYDEIHAYEVLEHTGTQGDAYFFFEQFNELWRALKAGGYLCLSVPVWTSNWAWGDPGHRRVLPPEVFSFLTRAHYDQVGETASADYRSLIHGYWIIRQMEQKDSRLFVLLQKV